MAAAQRALAQVQGPRGPVAGGWWTRRRSQVGRLASAAYRSGGIDQTLELLLADDPAQFLEQMTALDSVTPPPVRCAAGGGRRPAALGPGQAGRRSSWRALQAAAGRRGRTRGARPGRPRSTGCRHARGTAGRGSRSRPRPRAQAKARARRSAVQPRARRGHSRSGGRGTLQRRASAVGSSRYALSKVGDSYVWGASGPNAFDCSGLTHAGVRARRDLAAALVERPVRLGPARLAQFSLQPGDLVFFYSPIHHVGIYIGGGMIVHAANPGEGVTTAPLSSMPYSGAVRPY